REVAPRGEVAVGKQIQSKHRVVHSRAQGRPSAAVPSGDIAPRLSAGRGELASCDEVTIGESGKSAYARECRASHSIAHRRPDGAVPAGDEVSGGAAGGGEA